jgi:Zn finger protein HypA/HybF involved in hydrogenase expression
MKINTTKLKCKRCGHEWTPRKDDVRLCPSCHSAYWDLEKKVADSNLKEASSGR